MPLLLMLTTRNYFCDVYTTLNHGLTENYQFYQFRKVPIEHMRRVWIADRGTHSSGQLTRPIWRLHILLRPKNVETK